MRKFMIAGLVAAAGLVAGGLSGAHAATTTSAVLKGDFLQGGVAQLQVETGNVEPTVCFWFSHPLPTDGDSIRADVRRAGTLELVQTLGTGAQWMGGSAAGCEVPTATAPLAALLATPSDYVVTFEVIETQGGPPVPGVFTTVPLARA